VLGDAEEQVVRQLAAVGEDRDLAVGVEGADGLLAHPVDVAVRERGEQGFGGVG
jgi:hypothetical protein